MAVGVVCNREERGFSRRATPRSLQASSAETPANTVQVLVNVWLVRSKSTFFNIGQYSEIVNIILKYFPVFGNIWPYLTIFGNIWQYLTILDNIWQY